MLNTCNPLKAVTKLLKMGLLISLCLVTATTAPMPAFGAQATAATTLDDPDSGDWPRYTSPVHCPALFTKAFSEQLGTAYRGTRFTAAVHDHRSGCSHYLNPGLQLTTASVIKAQVLAGVLLSAQQAKRLVTTTEGQDIRLMMHYSHNRPPTSRLYAQLGSAEGMEELDQLFGIAGTTHSAWYGRTLSTAEDRTRLVEQLLIGGGPLNQRSVATAWRWMSAVSVPQSWGITAGLPYGYRAALKNGFYPTSGAGWRLGTTGVVRDHNGGAYAVTVMTDNNPNESAGIELVEQITRRINSRLASGTPALRPLDLITCIQTEQGTSWAEAAQLLGEVDTARLKLLNGGEEATLAGQRICWDS